MSLVPWLDDLAPPRAVSGSTGTSSESLVILCPGWALLCSLSHETNLSHSFRVIISRAGDVGGELSESVVAV